ncbi:hypothetical protein GCM10010193_18970 [Kitasatospora atroaurantiaca]|uniref:Uncharacterized protein n=1 Tax=Kitasatospora atroaurantiaca TaxID=285545 RepID=A0A561EPI5_9ACTN|nr:hypothetical protein [Kitasatospora atroaurantiaca]TWE17489.1 hypothetical protein FB465_2516 [Kitasatospora atroaurantiaca]
MAGCLPATTAALRVAVAVTGAALIAVGLYDGRWAPVLIGLALAVLAAAELALARVRGWIGETDARVQHHLAEAAAQQARLTSELVFWQQRYTRERRESDARIQQLTGLLDATRRELVQAHVATATARAELAELSTEWNALVQEAMQMGADVFGPRDRRDRRDLAPRAAASRSPGATRQKL